MLDPDRSIEPVLQKAERSAARQEDLHTLVTIIDSGLASVLLHGFIQHDRNGLPHQKYLEKESEEERDARRALVTLLRSDTPLDRDMRHALAELFDPDPPCGPGVPNLRELVFKFRNTSRRTDHVRNTAIAQHVFRIIECGKSWDEAIGDVANKFDQSEGTVRNIWRRYQWAKRLGLFKSGAV